MSLKDRMAVVTGAGSGIGRGIALALAARGASVAAVDLDAASAKETAELIAAADGRAEPFRHATVVGFDRAGHWLHHDRLEEFLRIVRKFLAEDPR